MIEDLKQQLSPEKVKTDKESLNTYGKDWTKFYQPNACAVVFPANTQDVVSIVQWARKNNIAVIPSGGRTGLSGGAFATQGEVVVSLEKMNQISDFSSTENTVQCQAGVITEELQHFAKQNNLLYPVDFAASGSSHIAGNVATNAGGIRVLRLSLIHI